MNEMNKNSSETNTETEEDVENEVSGDYRSNVANIESNRAYEGLRQ